MFKGKRRIKRILRRGHLNSLGKGEERHNRIQAVSPSFFWKRKTLTRGGKKRYQKIYFKEIMYQ